MRPPELATLLMAWQSARLTVIASSTLIDEYLHILDYPHIQPLLYPELRRGFLTYLLPNIEIVHPTATPQICRDPDDDKVIAAAVYGLADYLVTVDEDLLTSEVATLLQDLGIAVISGDDLIGLLDSENR